MYFGQTPTTPTTTTPTEPSFKPNTKALLFWMGVFTTMTIGVWGVGKYFDYKTRRLEEED